MKDPSSVDSRDQLSNDARSSFQRLCKDNAQNLVTSAHLKLLEKKIRKTLREERLVGQESRIRDLLSRIRTELCSKMHLIDAEAHIVEKVLPHLIECVNNWDPNKGASLSNFLYRSSRQPINNYSRDVEIQRSRFKPISSGNDEEEELETPEFHAPCQFVPNANRIIENSTWDHIRVCHLHMKDDPPHRFVWILKEYYHHNYKKIADLLCLLPGNSGIKETTVRMWHHRAKDEFKAAWKTHPNSNDLKDALGIVGTVIALMDSPYKDAFLIKHFGARDYFLRFKTNNEFDSKVAEAEKRFGDDLTSYGWGGTVLNHSPVSNVVRGAIFL